MRGRKPAVRPLADGDRLTKTPRAPAHLSKEARKTWQDLAPVLVERRILAREALELLSAYCEAAGAVRRAYAAIKRDGDYVKSPGGVLRRHPAFSTIAQAGAEMRRLAAELSITPTSRDRVPARARDDDFADLDL